MTLYILKAIPSGLFKIGITDQFDRRLSAIRRQNSEQVLVVSTYHGESDYIRELEKDLHAELKPVRWQCEWYYGGPEVEAVLDRLDRQFFPEKYSDDPNVVPSSIGV
jgi:Meiotically up-regulated gene 113